MEIAVEKDDEDAAEVFFVFTKPIELFIHSVQRPCTKYANLVDDQQVFLLLVYPDCHDPCRDMGTSANKPSANGKISGKR